MLQIVIESNWRLGRSRTTWETRRHTGVAGLNFLFYWFSVADLGCLIIFNFSLNMLLNLGQPCTVKFWPALSSLVFIFCCMWYMVISARADVVFLLYHVCMCLCMCVQACLLEGDRERERGDNCPLFCVLFCWCTCSICMCISSFKYWHSSLTWSSCKVI